YPASRPSAPDPPPPKPSSRETAAAARPPPVAVGRLRAPAAWLCAPSPRSAAATTPPPSPTRSPTARGRSAGAAAWLWLCAWTTRRTRLPRAARSRERSLFTVARVGSARARAPLPSQPPRRRGRCRSTSVCLWRRGTPSGRTSRR
ncbi:unnamed protein product, partial [Ectocarpus sp. 12 AP-2014]